MNIQAKKLNLIEWLIRLQDETVISKIEILQKKARITAYEQSLTPMTSEALIRRANRSNEDITAGRTLTTEGLKKEVANW